MGRDNSVCLLISLGGITVFKERSLSETNFRYILALISRSLMGRDPTYIKGFGEGPKSFRGLAEGRFYLLEGRGVTS